MSFLVVVCSPDNPGFLKSPSFQCQNLSLLCKSGRHDLVLWVSSDEEAIIFPADTLAQITAFLAFPVPEMQFLRHCLLWQQVTIFIFSQILLTLLPRTSGGNWLIFLLLFLCTFWKGRILMSSFSSPLKR